MSDSPDELGSLAQSARKTSLKSARTILFVLAGLQMIAGVIFMALAGPMAKSELDKEVNALGGAGAVDQGSLRQAQEEGEMGMRIAAVFVGGLGLVFLVLGLIVYKIPVAATVTALVLFISMHLLDAAFDPASLAKGFIMKVIIFFALIRAVQAAIAYERENRAMAAERPELDPI